MVNMKLASSIFLVALIGTAGAFSVAPQTTRTSTALKALEPENAGILAQSSAAIAAGGAAIAAGVAAIYNSVRKGGSTETATSVVEKEEELPPIDVSIPYNSAAMLAFDEWKGDKTFPEDTFAKFETIYEEKVVAMVTAKKVQRELDEAMTKADGELAKLAKLGEEPASESE